MDAGKWKDFIGSFHHARLQRIVAHRLVSFSAAAVGRRYIGTMVSIWLVRRRYGGHVAMTSIGARCLIALHHLLLSALMAAI